MKQIAPDQWLLDVRVCRFGKQYRARVKFSGGRKAAKDRASELRRELRAKADKAPRSLKQTGALTFGEALDFYLARKKIGDSRHYIDRLKADLGAHPLVDFGPVFDQWVLLLRQEKSRQTGKHLSPATVNRFIAWSKAALNFCLTYKVIKENPIAYIQKTKEIPRDVTMNDIERQRLFNVLEQEAPFLVPLVRFALLVPCRTGELLQMRRDDLDLFNNAIRVRHGVMKNKELATWKPVPPSMRGYFAEISAVSEYLFPQKIGDRYEPLKDFPYTLFRRCLKLAGLEGLRLHDCRHQAVSSLLNNNTPEQVVCSIAGWTSSAMLKVYYHRDGLQSLKMARFGDDPLEKVSTVPPKTAINF